VQLHGVKFRHYEQVCGSCQQQLATTLGAILHYLVFAACWGLAACGRRRKLALCGLLWPVNGRRNGSRRPAGIPTALSLDHQRRVCCYYAHDMAA
jgi:hypothetical protein